MAQGYRLTASRESKLLCSVEHLASLHHLQRYSSLHRLGSESVKYHSIATRIQIFKSSGIDGITFPRAVHPEAPTRTPMLEKVGFIYPSVSRAKRRADRAILSFPGAALSRADKWWPEIGGQNE